MGVPANPLLPIVLIANTFVTHGQHMFPVNTPHTEQGG